MSEVGSILIPLFALVFVVGSMLAMGLSLTIQMIAKPLKKVKTVAFALFANFVVMPLVTIGVLSVLPLQEDIQIAFYILALAAGAPFLPKLAQFAKADIAFAVGLMTLLMVATVIILPIFLPLMLSGITINPWDIVRPLLFLLLLPLGIGLLVRQRYEEFAKHTAKLLNSVTTVSLLALLFLFFIAYWDAIISTFGTGAIAFSIFFIAFALVAGYLISPKETGIRRVSSLGTAQRNISVGILVAAVNFADQPLVGVTVLIVSLVGLVFLMVTAGEWGRKSQKEKQSG
ncbi:MAG: bile acid:sodium symporter [Candidatus Bathyarchaeota archaeon]|nr:bile acid:sodium symporter [Candidatus Bathyarchaeota archaeon]